MHLLILFIYLFVFLFSWLVWYLNDFTDLITCKCKCKNNGDPCGRLWVLCLVWGSWHIIIMGVRQYHNFLFLRNNNLNGELSFRDNRSMAGTTDKTYRIMVISPAVIVSYHRNRGITKTSFVSKDNFWNCCHTNNVSTPHFKHSTFSLGWEAWAFNNNHCAWSMMRQIQFFGNFSKNLKKNGQRIYFIVF